MHLATLTHHTRCRAGDLGKNCPSLPADPRDVFTMLFLSRDDESFRRRDPQDLALKILRSTFDSSTITGLPESSRPGVRVIYD